MMDALPPKPPESFRERLVDPPLLRVAILAFGSGALALCYELVWFKRLAQLIGSSSLAIASAVGAFLAGLGIGSWIGGRLARRPRRPILAFAACELAVAAWALASIVMFRWAGGLPAPASGGFAQLAGQAAIALLLIAPPAVFMGAGLPFFVQDLAARGAGPGRAASWLYGWNSAGAGVGAFIAGFFLLGTFGLTLTTQLAAAANVVLALGALALGRSLGSPRIATGPMADETGGRTGEASVQSTADVSRRGLPSGSALRLAALMFGAGAMGLEIAWTREISVLIGGSTYVFSAVLAVYVLGLGLGSLLLRALSGRIPEKQALTLGVLVVVGCGLFGRWVLLAWPQVVGAVMPLRASAGFDAVLTIGVTASVLGGTTIGLGFLFPLLVALARGGSGNAGRAFGDIGFWNTLGTLLGVTLAGWSLLPLLATHHLQTASLALFPLGLLLVYPPLEWKGARVPLLGAISAGLLLVLPWPVKDPRVSHFGMAFYGARQVDKLVQEFALVEFRQGRSLDVLVLDHPDGRTLRVNGKVDASDTRADMQTQLGLAVLPRILRPSARDVLVIGFGSGATSGASLAFTGATVTCCEIEPDVFAISPHFHHVNLAPEEHPNYVAVPEDGRRFLATHDTRYDLVISAPSNPWMSGVSNLFTDEFYELVASRLNEDGLFAQWMQLYALDALDFERVMRTLSQHFPHLVLFRTGETDAMLVAAQRPILPTSPGAARARLAAATGLEALLESVFGTIDAMPILFESLWLTENGVQRWLADMEAIPIHTDDRLQLEFRAPRKLFDVTGKSGRNPEQLLLELYSAEDVLALADTLGLGASIGEVLVRRASAFTRLPSGSGGRDVGLQLYNWIETHAPAEAENCLVERLLAMPAARRGHAQNDIDALIANAPVEALRLARGMLERGQPKGARPVLEALSDGQPMSTTIWLELARTYAALGELQFAEAALAKARELDPLHPLFEGAEGVGRSDR